MAVELYSRALAHRVSRASFPLLINAGTRILAELIQAGINFLKQNNTVNIADLQLDKSIFQDLSVLRSDAKDRWIHVFTEKHGHVKPARDEEKGLVALLLEMVRKLGENVPILGKIAENFKRRYELFFKDSKVRIWVRECRKGNSDEYYIESGGMYIDDKAGPDERDTGGELLKIL